MEHLYIFNEDYKLKYDLKRVILYSRNVIINDSSVDWGSFIHPLQAKLLNIFNKPITLNDAINRCSIFLPNTPRNEIKKILTSLIENKTPFYVETKNKKIKFPKNLIIKSVRNTVNRQGLDSYLLDQINEVDLSTKRLFVSPLDIVFMLTNRCFTHCAYCYADLKTVSNNVHFDIFKELVLQAKSLNVRYIDLIGGDIFRKNDWNQYLQTLIEHGFSPRFISTKKPLTNNDLEKLHEIGYKNELQFSLDSMKTNVLKDLLGVNQEYLCQIMKSILCADKKGLNIRVNTVITSVNCNEDDLLSMCRFLNKLDNIIEWEIRVFMPSLYLENNINNSLTVGEKDTQSLEEFIQSNLRPISKHKIIFFNTTKFYPDGHLSNNSVFDWRCSANNSSFFILPDGKVTICEQLYWDPRFIIGDINKSTISEVWNSKEANYLANLHTKIKTQNSPCSLCEFNLNCFTKSKRCWINVLKYNGQDKWLHPDPNCINFNSNNFQ